MKKKHIHGVNGYVAVHSVNVLVMDLKYNILLAGPKKDRLGTIDLLLIWRIAMNQVLWGLQIAAVGLIVISSVMLVRDWNQPSGDDVVFAVEVPATSTGGSESPLVMNIKNGTNVDIRIVGMNWC